MMAETPIVSSDPFEASRFARQLVSQDAAAKSWREKLAVVQELVADESCHLADAELANVAVYLRFLNTGGIPCVEDGRHFRPSHHARMATQIHEQLVKLIKPTATAGRITPCAPPPGYSNDGAHGVTRPASIDGGVPRGQMGDTTAKMFLIRKIMSCLPSTAAPFQRAEPLTRIRDIAHRNDIPHDLKREIKATLQNKLHRCAGPEDLVTSQRLLERIAAPEAHYAPDFVEQFRIFHGELAEFFNARSLEERLHALASTTDESTRNLINGFLEAKRQQAANAQSRALASLTQLRERLLDVAEGKTGAEHQELWLADTALEDYAFVLLSELANKLGAVPPSPHPASSHSLPIGWREGQGEGPLGGTPATDASPALDLLALALSNLRLSQISSEEVVAIQNELAAARAQLKPRQRDSMLRLKAAIERARRLAGEFSDGVLAQLAGRAATLGGALGVAPHAIQVFAEGEVRGHLAFQLAKLTSDLLRQLRAAIGQSPWDVIVTGQALGRLVFADRLGESTVTTEPRIVVLAEAEGDEEIPAGVTGLLLAHELPHLSHLGVRARQAGVIVAGCEEASVWQQLNAFAGQHVTLTATPEGIAIQPANTSGPIPSKPVGQARAVPLAKLQARTAVLPLENIIPATGGNKADGARQLLALAQRVESGFSAPEGLVVPFGVMESCLQADARIYAEYESLTARANRLEEGEFTAAVAQLRQLILGAAVPSTMAAAVAEKFGRSQRLAVRSSANSEDLAHMAGAGLHESVAGVTADAFDLALRTVWSSLWTERAAASRRQAGIPHEAAHMAVLIQPLVEPDLSFILHTVNPQNNNPGECYVELAAGLGETLASGATRGTPYRVVCERETGRVTMLAFANFSQALEAEADGRLAGRRLDYSCVPFTTGAALRAKLGARLAHIATVVEREFGAPQDVEGVIRGEEIILVQSRVQQGIPTKP